mgnify:FL=1|jgi:hypothetical protein|nr:hypothetical protein [Zea mays]WEB51543.1 hypothetical protein [Zea mays]WEB51690.1 hypothetical protein [Zea mays]WEB51703.1 hypothetical protein [Zea mays]
MVSPPRDWKNRRASKWVKASDMNRLTHKARDLSGGYLNSEGAVSRKTTLLSSKKDEGNFHIYMVNDSETEVVLSSLNKLQSVQNKINAKFLSILRDHWDDLVNIGLVMPSILSSINRKEGEDRLRRLWLKNKKIMDYFSVQDLINIWEKNIQAAHYEQYLLQLADALVGYKIYFHQYGRDAYFKSIMSYSFQS